MIVNKNSETMEYVKKLAYYLRNLQTSRSNNSTSRSNNSRTLTIRNEGYCFYMSTTISREIFKSALMYLKVGLSPSEKNVCHLLD